MLIGYARTSTVDQVAGLEAQEAALAATGCSKIVKEQASSVGQRDGLAAVLDFVREGDTLVISRLDRLARSTADLLGIVATLEAKQVALRILDFGGSEVDTRSPTGRMLLTMFERANSLLFFGFSSLDPGIVRVGFREAFLPKCLKKEAAQTGPSLQVGLVWVKPKLPSAFIPKSAENLAFRAALPSPS